MYAQQHVICICDSHLFQHPLPDLLRARLGIKRRFLEKAEFLLKEEVVHQTSAERSDLSAQILFQYSQESNGVQSNLSVAIKATNSTTQDFLFLHPFPDIVRD